jgi:hypothetical protein
MKQMKSVMAAQIIVLAFVFTLAVVMLIGSWNKSMMDYNSMFRSTSWTVSLLIVTAAALFLVFRKDTFLPFLGCTVLPAPLLANGPSAPADSNTSVIVTLNEYVPDGTRVIYWASQPSHKVVENPWDAYGDYRNSGVAIAKDGKAEFRFHCPSRYHVPWGGSVPLRQHVHYRHPSPRLNGMLCPVKTTFITCNQSSGGAASA